MPRNHKPNPRAVLKVMSDAKQAQLRKYMRDHSLADGVAYCEKTLNVSTNDTSLSDWVAWYDMTERINGYNAEAEEFMGMLQKRGIDEDLVPLLGQTLFLNSAARSGDVKGYAAVANVMQRHFELKASKAAHADKMELGREQVKARRKALAIAMRKLRAAEKRIAALEAKNELMRQAAKNAKGKLAGAAAKMTDKQRAELVDAMDEIILGKRRKKAAAEE